MDDTLSQDEALGILADMAGGKLSPGKLSDAEARVQRAEARYRSLVEQIPAVTFMASMDETSNELYVSPQIEQLLGFTQKEWLEDPTLWYRQLHPEDKMRWTSEFAQVISLGALFQSEYRFLAKDGRTVWVRGAAKLVRDEEGRPLFIQGIAFDITGLKEAEEAIRASLHEKEVLLKEVHHRVKNNLQITSGLLSLQASAIQDPRLREVLVQSQNRINAMAMVHEKLYQSETLAAVSLRDYVEELVPSLLEAFGQSARIALILDLEPAGLGVDKAIPFGLILNELVSNCVKHAFPHGKHGTIRVVLRAADGNKQISLSVIDDGQGFAKGFDMKNPRSLGLKLINGLAQQLGAAIDVRSESGTEFCLTFSP